ncbi:transcription termination factor MTEF1, chloroplastic-like [Cucurbita moschata]|uniref:Transcription termination factor MTEF1, chloroplastic-like n=1 Tax=Cucurbita moschata TaxID=3662 RepID=A0A6J1GT19_CUCMO|nr:transcription termination factor MTEF1, chloroplastic-like [Cucurbita moschata]
MPATPFHSSLCFSSSSSSSSSSPSNSHQPNPFLSPKPTTLLFHKHPPPLLHSTLSSQTKEKILCLEVMGVDAGKALSLNPSLHSATLQSIHSVISFLQSKGIHQKDFAKIFGMCPKVLTSDVKTDLIPVFTFLSEDLKVPDQNFRRAINKCPRLLASSAKDQLKPTLFYLQRLGLKDLEALAYHDPVLLVSSVEKTLIPKLRYLGSLGFSKSAIVGMVLRCPALLTFSIENNFKPKFEYFSGEMHRKLEELEGFPQYFSFSLEKRIKPRYVETEQSGKDVSLSLMLKSTDDEFRELLREGA